MVQSYMSEKYPQNLKKILGSNIKKLRLEKTISKAP
jgi:hypothetical protein